MTAMTPIEAVLEALDGVTVARTLWPDDARAYAAAIRESLPRIYTAETIGDAVEATAWWLKTPSGKWVSVGTCIGAFNKKEVVMCLEANHYTHAVPIQPPEGP